MMIKSSKYLYGVDPKEWAEQPYRDALVSKISFGMAHKKKIAKEAAKHLAEPLKYTQLITHYNDVEKAIEFNKKLLEELDYE